MWNRFETIPECYRHRRVTDVMRMPYSQPSIYIDGFSALKSALQQIWDDFPQTTINKAINDFHKRLNAAMRLGRCMVDILNR